MVHIEDKYINKTTKEYDWDGALADPNGLAVLGIFFNVDPKKPQVLQPILFHDMRIKNKQLAIFKYT